jgi:hypothetical protein
MARALKRIKPFSVYLTAFERALKGSAYSEKRQPLGAS